MLGLDVGVHITVGLPVVRTSVDHGAAFDIAGTGQADEAGMLAAVRQVAQPHLAASSGVVINVGSLSGIKPGSSSVPYAVTKAALHQQTRMLAAALAPRIRVNAVAPGIADTAWTEGMGDARAAAVRDIPLGRMATAGDVARVIVTQVLSPYVTGAVWRVDGGSGLIG
ncbi:MAG TPA: SDR family oxidoreductase [Pseudonocardiaceae bacterium]|nr:SDR family oxidoreductase [Pseudonocardiaceae bacterium]